MKNLLLVFLSSSLAACSSTNIVTMTVTEPAPVDLPPNMKRIGIINRSQSPSKNQVLDKIDQVLSVKGKDFDKDGSLQSISGLSEELKRNGRFVEVKDLEDEILENPGLGIFPNPVSWDKVSEICDRNGLDGLFLLELYDTDSKINYSTRTVELKNPFGLKVPVLEHQATANTLIKTGWRIYDNNSRYILDRFSINRGVATMGRGINPVEAAAAITGRKEAVNLESYKIGQAYALSIVPYQIRVSRDYFVRGNDNFKLAKRKAQTGNWDGAAEIWKEETKNPKSKTAGRAFYNMAIICEINGKVDLAIDWARKSYENFGNRQALQYLNILERRKIKIQALNRQESNN